MTLKLILCGIFSNFLFAGSFTPPPVVYNNKIESLPTVLMSSTMTSTKSKYSLADQKERFARAKRENNQRYLDITTVYDPSRLKGLRVAVTGANKGNGLALAKELKNAGAHVIAITRSNSEELKNLEPDQLIDDVDVTDDEAVQRMAKMIKGPIDVLINNAGYFPKGETDLENLKFDKELLAIDICAIGPLRVSAALINEDKITKGSKIVTITSQGGSVSWREVQNPNGGDYGHHMSKAAANMMMMLLKKEVEDKDIIVGMFHPGFNKTEMTERYRDIWDEEGAVDPSVGAKRILYETLELNMEKSGKFRNVEDGLEIPF